MRYVRIQGGINWSDAVGILDPNHPEAHAPDAPGSLWVWVYPDADSDNGMQVPLEMTVPITQEEYFLHRLKEGM